MKNILKNKIKVTPYMIIFFVIGIGMIIMGVVYFLQNYKP